MGVSLSTTYVPDWQSACAARFNCTSSGLVDIFRQPISCPATSTIQATPAIWGITFDACQAQCGPDVLVQSVNLYSAAIPITTWLLPWIALIAQLPFETDGWMDLLSACLCVGSPALATYSLALTAFNRGYIATRFRGLKERVDRELTDQRYQYMAERVSAAEFMLQETQQCPMRANQRTGELASLIVLPNRQKFWRAAKKDLKNTRRGFTYSFLAQVILAFLSYLISFVASVHDSLGSPDVGLQFASSSVWSWMFPIVFGYIRVGSQYKAGAIKEALDNPVIPQSDEDTEEVYQDALLPNADLYLALRYNTPSKAVAMSPGPSFYAPTGRPRGLSTLSMATTVRDLDLDPNTQESIALLARTTSVVQPDNTISTIWRGIDVRGDERREGPIFNYARILTWFAFASHVARGFETAILHSKNKERVPETADDAAERCGLLPQEDLQAFFALPKIPAAAIQNMLYAAGLALFLQWGTTGAAIFVAYSTPAVGWGCRSGSYLIYGIAATVSWLLLVFSSFVSHSVMQTCEATGKPPAGKLSALAILSSVAGKTIAVANAGWLIASSVMEDIGTFQTCWCQTCAFHYHTSGWTPVFKGASDLRAAASDIWIGGFMWSIVVCSIVIVIFAFGRH
ncbi:hypothetical protein K438DRAFT_1981400 [Mycena galopus ATCC 62051]|nr:hypothetical protein K438DRAFT_1981400 [Mycena galopus ATCC 62051]